MILSAVTVDSQREVNIFVHSCGIILLEELGSADTYIISFSQ